ncbi:MAG: glycosyltransferase family 4 protein [Gammaproteobacteria bacterium]|nr:glycosyltransferase family 4 protein [Gammaproteobacteria bacterium]MBP9728707.1 glycosyltransferase family 4 protein [Gammaproteobacteria bacterium]
MTQSQPSIVMLTTDRQIDRRILLQADSLEAAGWKVTIIAMPLDTKMNEDPRVVRIGSDAIDAKQENRVLDAYRWVRKHMPMNGRLMRWMKRQAWCYLVDQESFYTKLFYSTASRYAPRVFVAHDLPILPLAKQVADRCGARLVYDSHELYSEQSFSSREKQRWAQIEAKYIGACNAVITVNPSIALALQKRYGIAEIKVIYNAERSCNTPIKTGFFHTLFNLTTDKKILLFQGGLSAERNLEVLLEAMQYVQHASVVLIILGDGLLLKTLQTKTRSKVLDRKVFFHPAVAQKDLVALTAQADAGVIPYQATCLNNHLCTPNKLFEFIAAGIPILASDLPEIRKIVEGQAIGLVGDTSTPKKLALLMDAFFSDEQRFTCWKAHLTTVRKTICWEAEEKKLLDIYKALA